MKKILLTTAAIAALSSSALATDGMFAMGGDTYGALELGWSNLVNTKTKDTVLTDATGSEISKSKKATGENAFLFGIRGGYNITEDWRMDLSYHHFFGAKYKLKKSDSVSGGMTTKDGSKKSTINLNINTFLVNGYYDVLDLDVAKLYAGAGIGFSYITGDMKAEGQKNKFKMKSKTSFAYQLQVGLTSEVTHGVHAELAYSWRHFADKSFKFKGANGVKGFTTKIKDHVAGNNIALGLRFDI